MFTSMDLRSLRVVLRDVLPLLAWPGAPGDLEGLRRLALWKVQSRYVQERSETAIHRLDMLR